MPEKREPEDPNPLLLSAQQMQDNFRVLLDMLDGALAETLRRGWPEPQARAMVMAMFVPRHSGS